MSDSDCDLWTISLDTPVLDHLRTTLSPDEFERGNKLRLPWLRRNFLAGRITLRLILSTYLKICPHDLIFDYGEHGKPRLRGFQALHFNVAHSGSLFICAVSHRAEIGVDLERARNVEGPEAIARRYFAEAEIQSLLSLPSSMRGLAFVNVWTKKEALVKGWGDTVSKSFRKFNVTLDQDSDSVPCRRECVVREARGWQVVPFEPAQGYFAAVAVCSDTFRGYRQRDARPLLATR